MKFKDKVVLITGGTSGIGRIMARMACERGARWVIVCILFNSVEPFISNSMARPRQTMFILQIKSSKFAFEFCRTLTFFTGVGTLTRPCRMIQIVR